MSARRPAPRPARPLVRWAVSGALLLASACGESERSPPAGEAADPAAPLRLDRRVVELLQGCARGGFYDRDLSDPVPVLLAKLEHARPDPLKRAKEELGLLGARAFPALGHAFQGYFNDLMRSAFLENVVDALAFNASAESHELLLESLQHAQESVRGKALDGLARLALPQDFALLAQRLAIETPELRRQSVAALFQADRTAAERLFLGFVEAGEQRDLWLPAAPRLAQCEDGESARQCARLFAGVEPILGVNLAAGAARHGDVPALEFLRAELGAEDTPRRLAAVNALQLAGLTGELRAALLADSASEVRAIAAAAVGAGTLDEERRTWLRAALNDSSPIVQAQALRCLCEHDDPEGLARALAQLDGEPSVLQPALQALRAPWQRDRAIALTALERLRQRNALEEHRPIQQRSATFKAIGQVPLAAAAELLRSIALAAGEERIESLRAHDWLMIQAANTGLEGRAHLAAVLPTESDPLRRLDLIDAIGSARDALAREELLKVVEDERGAPLERLFAAAGLVKIGPSWEVAPRLKRVAFALQAPGEVEARGALQCLLWQWY